MDEVESPPQQPQTKASQAPSQPASQQQTVEAAPQQPLEPIAKPKKKKWWLSIFVVVIILLLGIGTVMIFVNNSSENELTIEEGLKIAESINPYIPEGYSISYKAKLVEFPSGGVLFDTQLVSGENKIGIILRPGDVFECESDTEQVGKKTVCVLNTASSRGIKWVDGKVTYQVLTGSPGVTLGILEKIVESL